VLFYNKGQYRYTCNLQFSIFLVFFSINVIKMLFVLPPTNLEAPKPIGAAYVEHIQLLVLLAAVTYNNGCQVFILRYHNFSVRLFFDHVDIGSPWKMHWQDGFDVGRKNL